MVALISLLEVYSGGRSKSGASVKTQAPTPGKPHGSVLGAPKA